MAQKYIDKITHSADIVMFGDSHTIAGQWNTLISKKSVKIIAKGGCTSGQLIPLITQSFKYHPKYVFILCGGNDISMPCFSIDNVISNLKYMGDTLRSMNICPVFQKLFYQYNNPSFNNIIDSINNKLEYLCYKNHFFLIDVSNGMYDSTGLKKNLTIDGKVHLNKKGYEIWGHWINKFLKDNK